MKTYALTERVSFRKVVCWCLVKPAYEVKLILTKCIYMKWS